MCACLSLRSNILGFYLDLRGGGREVGVVIIVEIMLRKAQCSSDFGYFSAHPFI